MAQSLTSVNIDKAGNVRQFLDERSGRPVQHVQIWTADNKVKWGLAKPTALDRVEILHAQPQVRVLPQQRTHLLHNLQLRTLSLIKRTEPNINRGVSDVAEVLPKIGRAS